MDNTKIITEQLLKKLATFKPEVEERVIGTVTAIADGVAKVSGLAGVSYLEMVEFPKNIIGVAINLEEQEVGVIILGDYLKLKEGDEVRNTGKLLSIPVTEALIGRVLDPLGVPLDGKGAISSKTFYPIEKVAPGVTARQPVNTPLATGIKAIDAMIPIGRGQRELIIGDRGTGKTQIALDTIINQKGKDVICIYVAIGQKASRVAQVIEALDKHGAMEHTVVVCANASDPASLQYLAPYAGSAIGEYFMQKGKDVLVVFDDLSKHAVAYRQMSLLLRRPPGREAFPGDIFYLHSRLLERSAKLSAELGGGSLTALPIIETQEGDVSAYIPTNVISITDGQIFLETDLFNKGVRPALNVGISVSRVGSSAQTKAMKKVAGKIRLELAQFRELEAFMQFASDLDEETKKRIDSGRAFTELLKQKQGNPQPFYKQVVSLFAANNGYMEGVQVSQIKKLEEDFLSYIEREHADILSTIETARDLSDESQAALKTAIVAFKETYTA